MLPYKAVKIDKINYRTSHQNSSLFAVTRQGEIISHTIYDVWGLPEVETYIDSNYSGIEIANFTGYSWDEVGELYFAQNRFYDPNNKTFIQKDPIKDGSNWYAYCGNNPVNFIDWLGLMPGDMYINDVLINQRKEIDHIQYGSLADLTNAYGGTISHKNGGIYEAKVGDRVFEFDLNKKNVTSQRGTVTEYSAQFDKMLWKDDMLYKKTITNNGKDAKVIVPIQEYINEMAITQRKNTKIKYELGDKGGTWVNDQLYPYGVRSMVIVPKLDVDKYYKGMQLGDFISDSFEGFLDKVAENWNNNQRVERYSGDYNCEFIAFSKQKTMTEYSMLDDVDFKYVRSYEHGTIFYDVPVQNIGKFHVGQYF